MAEQGNGTAPTRVLVVDDEINIAELISTALRYEGFETATAQSGSEALAEVRKRPPQLLILDVMLPDLDGFELARRLGAHSGDLPIIFLTAKDTTEDKIRGLTLGGDDYVTKPFSVEELIARVQTILRRVGGGSSANFAFADLELDEDSREVYRAGRPIELTNTEFRLLRYLLANPRRVLRRSEILDHVWNYDFNGDGRILETYISYLRRKLDAKGPSLIQTVRGVGYVLREPRA